MFNKIIAFFKKNNKSNANTDFSRPNRRCECKLLGTFGVCHNNSSKYRDTICKWYDYNYDEGSEPTCRDYIAP